MDYIDYHVEVTPDGQWVHINARHPDGTEAGQPRGRFGLGQPQDKIKPLADKVAQETASRQDIEHLGEILFGTLFFDPAMGEHFRSTFRLARDQKQGLRLELDFDEIQMPEAAALPWEFLRAPQTSGYPGFFLATDPNLVLSRRRSLWEPPRRIEKSGAWHILLVVAAPNEPDLGPVVFEPVLDDLRALTSQPGTRFAPLGGPILNADSLKIDEALSVEPDILHFIGHGRFISDLADPHGELAMVDIGGWANWLRDDDVGGLLERHIPAVVFLQACEGATLSSAKGLTGIASKVVQHNVPVVVAMQYPISNAAAVLFARKFYERLAAGDPVDKAAQEGRRALWFKYIGKREFATPVLFMRVPDGRLFVNRTTQPANDVTATLGSPTQSDRAELRQKLIDYFNREELRTICFDLNTQYDNFPETLDGMARELVAYCERNGRVPDLIKICKRLRPKVTWDDTSATRSEWSQRSFASSSLGGLNYVAGLERMRGLITTRAPDVLNDFLTFQTRLRENLHSSELYGDNETKRSERAQIVSSLNGLAQDAGLGLSFNDLCLMGKLNA